MAILSYFGGYKPEQAGARTGALIPFTIIITPGVETLLWADLFWSTGRFFRFWLFGRVLPRTWNQLADGGIVIELATFSLPVLLK